MTRATRQLAFLVLGLVFSIIGIVWLTIVLSQ